MKRNYDIVGLVREAALNVCASTMLARVQADKRVTRRAMTLLCDAAENLKDALSEMEEMEASSSLAATDNRKVRLCQPKQS